MIRHVPRRYRAVRFFLWTRRVLATFPSPPTQDSPDERPPGSDQASFRASPATCDRPLLLAPVRPLSSPQSPLHAPPPVTVPGADRTGPGPQAHPHPWHRPARDSRHDRAPDADTRRRVPDNRPEIDSRPSHQAHTDQHQPRRSPWDNAAPSRMAHPQPLLGRPADARHPTPREMDLYWSADNPD